MSEDAYSIAIIGNTGSGKSTFTNFIYGAKMEMVENDEISNLNTYII